jgi:hypothetical protein
LPEGQALPLQQLQLHLLSKMEPVPSQSVIWVWMWCKPPEMSGNQTTSTAHDRRLKWGAERRLASTQAPNREAASAGVRQ